MARRKNLSVHGAEVTIFGDVSLPNGYTLTAFSDSADAFSFADNNVKEVAYGTNGDKGRWDKINGIEVTISIMPDTEDEDVLDNVFQLNRPAKGVNSADDEFTIVITYKDGSTITFEDGDLLSGSVGKSAGSDGKLKNGVWLFNFAKMTKEKA